MLSFFSLGFRRSQRIVCLVLLFLLPFGWWGKVWASSSANINVQITAVAQCADGGDNDDDGLVDYPADPDCSSLSDNDESTPAPPATPPGGNYTSGGGGGGGTAPPIVTSVSFTGKAYPKSTVTILKDAQIIATTIAGSDAAFSASLSGLSGGIYVFSVYAEDQEGNRSSLLTFSISVTGGASTNVSGIFLAPTIDVDRKEVRPGDVLKIFGQTTPNADISITVNSDSEQIFKSHSDTNGVYLHYLDTNELELGQHYTKARAAANGIISPYSKAVGFLLSKTASRTPVISKKQEKSDLNKDARVNLVDFSVMAYWYKRPEPPVTIDLNSDGKINLVDFSILAFYWTG